MSNREEDLKNAMDLREQSKKKAKEYIACANGLNLKKIDRRLDTTGQEILSTWGDLLLEGLEPRSSSAMSSHKPPEKDWCDVDLWDEEDNKWRMKEEQFEELAKELILKSFEEAPKFTKGLGKTIKWIKYTKKND